MTKGNNKSKGGTGESVKRVVVTIAAAVMDIIIVLLKYYGKNV